jgi:hypothetical protein
MQLPGPDRAPLRRLAAARFDSSGSGSTQGFDWPTTGHPTRRDGDGGSGGSSTTTRRQRAAPAINGGVGFPAPNALARERADRTGDCNADARSAGSRCVVLCCADVLVRLDDVQYRTSTLLQRFHAATLPVQRALLCSARSVLAACAYTRTTVRDGPVRERRLRPRAR